MASEQFQQTIQQLTDALNATDTATTKSAEFTASIRIGVTRILQQIITETDMNKVNALAQKAIDLVAKTEANEEALKGIAADVAEPVPTPIPPPEPTTLP